MTVDGRDVRDYDLAALRDAVGIVLQIFAFTLVVVAAFVLAVACTAQLAGLEPVERLQRNGILIDGEGVVDGGETRILLQIFSKTVIGPIFFEFIQRKGDDGFGEGNFRALFESIEEDQLRRGVLFGAKQAAE